MLTEPRGLGGLCVGARIASMGYMQSLQKLLRVRTIEIDNRTVMTVDLSVVGEVVRFIARH